MRNKISTPNDIIDILRENPDFDNWLSLGLVNVKREDDKYLFNYRVEAGFEDDWNQFELMSRGLIIDMSRMEVSARPFDKFFNWGQQEKTTDARIDYVMDKMDGSLGICWYDYSKRSWRITTRGSFNSEQAIWATDYLNNHFLETFNNSSPRLFENMTMLFEIIYHGNRIVVDYDFEGLVLLGARNSNGVHFSLKNLSSLSELINIKMADTMAFNSVESIQSKLPTLDAMKYEGFVAIFQDGSRFKFKGDEYLKLHKLLSSLSFKNVLRAISEETFDELIQSIPDEFLSVVKQWQETINKEFNSVKIDISIAYWQICQEIGYDSRKEFAKIVMSKYKHLSPFLFALLDDKLTDSLIWRKHNFDFIEDEIA